MDGREIELRYAEERGEGGGGGGFRGGGGGFRGGRGGGGFRGGRGGGRGGNYTNTLYSSWNQYPETSIIRILNHLT